MQYGNTVEVQLKLPNGTYVQERVQVMDVVGSRVEVLRDGGVPGTFEIADMRPPT